MNKKIYALFGIKLLTILLVLCITLTFVSNLLVDKNDAFKHRDAINALPKKSVDVMIIGNSHAFCSLDALKIQKDTGLSTYNAAMPSQVLDLTWFNLVDFLEKQTPKVIILEAFAFQKPSNRDVFNDANLDSMGFNLTKITAIFHIFKSFKDRSQLLFKLYRHHGNWTNSQLVKQNFKQMIGTAPKNLGYLESRGFYELDSKMTEETAKKYKNMPEKDAKYAAEVNEYNNKYWQKIVEECKKRNIKLILTMSPLNKYFIQRINYKMTYDSFKSMAEASGIDYIDYNMKYEEMKFVDTDFVDEFHTAQHTNTYGADKISKHISEYLKKLDIK